jgi:phenylalanyl-tRNA synthetase beta chain
LQFGPKLVVGAFGELHPRALEALDAKGPLVGFEINLDRLPPPKSKPTKMKAKLVLSDFQPVLRDFAFVVPHTVTAGDVLKAAQAAERALITDVTLFDVYTGQGIADGHKSLAITVSLQPQDRTLTDADLESISDRIVAEVAKKTGAVLRA